MGACGAKEEESVKVLMLGTTGVGKSTVVRNMRLMTGDEFTEEERSLAAENTVSELRESLNKIFSQAVSEDYLEGNQGLGASVMGVLSMMKEESANTAEVFCAIQKINKTKKGKLLISEISEALAKEGKLSYSCKFYFTDDVFGKIGAGQFGQLSNTEMLFYRQSTRGSSNYMFRVRMDSKKIVAAANPPDGVTTSLMEVVDVGGHTVERSYWDKHFENINAIVFVVALDDYHKLTPENKGGTKKTTTERNRMHISMETFENVCRNEMIQSKPIVILFNKTDEFERKIKSKMKEYKLKKHFKEFKGTKSKKKSKAVEEGMFFIKDKYTSLFKDAERTCDELTIHDTCAVDTGIMEGVLNKVMGVVLNQSMQNIGMCQ